MEKTRMPTPEEIRELVAFLPRLYAEGFAPVRGWGGGTTTDDGTLIMPWPEYDELVGEFYRTAGSEGWCDYGYDPGDARRMLEDHEEVKKTTLSQIKTMLTFCVRGERFCDGHWAAMIEQGHIRRLLERLAVLAAGGSAYDNADAGNTDGRLAPRGKDDCATVLKRGM